MYFTEAYKLILHPDAAAVKERLALLLNRMIVHDFESLVQLLYRVDVPEQQVKQLLRQQPDNNAGLLLAELLLERQHQKTVLRKQFGTDSNDIPDEERW